MKLLEGKKISEKIFGDLKKKINTKRIKPGLAVVLVGDDKASQTYVFLKEKAAKKVGINFYKFKFKKNIPEKIIVEKIKELNMDKKVNGIIVQLPLPEKFNMQKIINLISPQKDVDGFHPKNLKLFFEGKEKIWPVFPKAIIKMLEFSKLGLKNKNAIIVANSKKFGETMKKALQRKNIKNKYILEKEFKKNPEKIKKADIVITAVGKPKMIKSEMIKTGAIVIDGGITKKNKKTMGDVDFSSVSKKASFISPVPGGVGPVTIACLLENVYLASLKK